MNVSRPAVPLLLTAGLLPCACRSGDYVTRDQFERGIQLSAERMTLETLEAAVRAKPDKDKLIQQLSELALTEKNLSRRVAAILATTDNGNTLFDALRAAQIAVDVCSNNLANAHTVAFKRQRPVLSDGSYDRIGGSGGVAGNRPVQVMECGTGVCVVALVREFEQGALEHTETQLNWAIEGEGFFRFDRIGIPVYSRNGSLNRDPEGDIVGARGYRLDPLITIPQNITDISITTDGRVLGFDPTSNRVSEIGRIQLVRFANPAGLRALGDTLFEGNEDTAGTPVEGNPGDAGIGIVRDRCLEKSNVDIVCELARLRVLRAWVNSLMQAIEAVSPSPEDGK